MYEKKNTAMRKQYKCTQCPKSFNTRFHLEAHLRTHSGEKPFECDTCGHLFTQLGNLTKHLRLHNGQRPFKCDFCGKPFTEAGNLRKHLRTHTGERPFKCDICDKCFVQSDHLKKHLLSIHSFAAGEMRPLYKARRRTFWLAKSSALSFAGGDGKIGGVHLGDDGFAYTGRGNCNIGTTAATMPKMEMEQYNNGDNAVNQQSTRQFVNDMDGTWQKRQPQDNGDVYQDASGNTMETSLNTTPYGDIASDGVNSFWPSFAQPMSPNSNAEINVTKLRTELNKVMAEKRELEIKMEAEKVRRDKTEKMLLHDRNRLQIELGKMRTELIKAKREAEMIKAEKMALEAQREVEKTRSELKKAEAKALEAEAELQKLTNRRDH